MNILLKNIRLRTQDIFFICIQATLTVVLYFCYLYSVKQIKYRINKYLK